MGTHGGNGVKVHRQGDSAHHATATAPSRRGPGPAAGGEAALWNLLVQLTEALPYMLAKAPSARGCKVVCPAMWSSWKSWRESLALWTDARLQVVQICKQEAGRIERTASRTRARAWKDWASTAVADGARLVHRWIKQVVPWADASVNAHGLAVQPQEQADLVAKEWHDLWSFGRTCQIDFGGVSNASVVPSPSPDDLRDVCGSFSAHTATSFDNLHPALHLEHVCNDALCVIAMILTLAANSGYCPAAFATIITVLLPEATGGMRLTGLFTSVLRPMDSQSGCVEMGAKFIQALLVGADCAHLPTCELEVQHGRGIRHVGGFLGCLGSH